MKAWEYSRLSGEQAFEYAWRFILSLLYTLFNFKFWVEVFLMKGESELKKELNLLEVTLVEIGNILGAGIYVLMGKAAALAGNMV